MIKELENYRKARYYVNKYKNRYIKIDKTTFENILFNYFGSSNIKSEYDEMEIQDDDIYKFYIYTYNDIIIGSWDDYHNCGKISVSKTEDLQRIVDRIKENENVKLIRENLYHILMYHTHNIYIYDSYNVLDSNYDTDEEQWRYITQIRKGVFINEELSNMVGQMFIYR